jgi:hypothetical protein
MSIRPRKGSSVGFKADDCPAPDLPDSISGLRFNIDARHGGSVLIDLRDLKPRSLAIAFAGALRREASVSGTIGAASTVRQHAHIYRRFFAYLGEAAPRIRGPADLRASHIDGFEAALEAAGANAIYRHIILAKPIIALRSIAALDPGLLDSGLRDRLTYTSAAPMGRSRPRDAWSPYVARQLRDASRADIERLFRRIGAPLAPIGDAVCQRTREQADAEIVEHGLISHQHPMAKLLYRTLRRQNLPTGSVIEDLLDRHHLLASDLPPLITLLSLDTGLEIECVKTLAIDCLRNPSAGTVELAYLKRRAGSAAYKTMRIRDGGIGTPGGLIRRLIEVTADARRHLPSQCLWVYHNHGRFHASIGHPRETIDAWTMHHAIVDDDGKPLRMLLSQLRKTHKALWYHKTQGHMARFAIGHTPEVAARHYADLPSLRPLHEDAVAAAFTEAVAAAAPIILPPDKEAEWRLAPTLPDTATADVEGLLGGDQDVWLAACGGFYNSPLGVSGKACPQPFWGCLECGNAVITARKLPAILAFLNFIEQERAGLAAADWQIKFGRAHARITQQVLPAFADAVVADARSAANAQLLYLPPEARA